jgi:drug/metabolite transporter (DMT)-like permease
VVEPLLPSGEAPPPEPHPLLGHAMVLSAATLFAVNGVVSKVILQTGVSAPRLTEVRCTGALLGLAVLLALVNPRSLRVSRSELPLLAVFGICGLAFVQWFYFAAIDRIAIGIALLIQYLAPVLVALWTRFVTHGPVRRRIWAALALALVGLSIVLEIWSGFALDGLGVAAALLAAVTYALYVLLAEREVGRRDPISLTTYGFLFATLFWAVIQPWWSFPFGAVNDAAQAAWDLPVWSLMAWMILLGTIVPFGLFVAALRFVSAARAAIIAMFEPVAATLVAWLWLGQALGAAQLAGGALVLAGILLAQSAR